MKYLREVTPYFRKTSALSDMGWGIRDESYASVDKRYLPLKLVYVTRNLSWPEPSDNMFEVHAPDGLNWCAFRCTDAESAFSWFTAIHAAVSELNHVALLELNETKEGAVADIKHIGWLAKMSHVDCWKAMFAVVTERDFIAFDKPPLEADSWTPTIFTHPLLATRIVHTGSNDSLQFGTRTGCRHGVESHVFRVDNQRHLSSWIRALVNGAHGAAAAAKEVSCSVNWNGSDARLTVHYENGFSLSKGDNVLWQYPFESLRSSKDDSIRTVTLNFDSAQYELDLQSNPKPFVFILHTFLSAKIHRLGLLA